MKQKYLKNPCFECGKPIKADGSYAWRSHPCGGKGRKAYFHVGCEEIYQDIEQEDATYTIEHTNRRIRSQFLRAEAKPTGTGHDKGMKGK